MLKRARRPLCATHDLAVLDLDGVVYLGRQPVPGAPEAVATARREGMHVAFVTNNASRTPDEVARHLGELGLSAEPADVVTSAQATARLVARAVAPGSEVFVIGGRGLEEALRERGLTPVTERTGAEAAVAQGYGPDMPFRQLAAGAMLVRSGLPWLVSNTDMTIPTDQGIGPGSGTVVRLVADFAGRTPTVAGKPEAPLYQETLDRVGGERPLMVGDRVDTDIVGARRLGWDTMLVLTGVTGLHELARVGADARPAYLGADLTALLEPHPQPRRESGGWSVGGWQARTVEGALRVRGEGALGDWWRCAAAAIWEHLDATGHPAEVDGVAVGEQAGG